MKLKKKQTIARHEKCDRSSEDEIFSLHDNYDMDIEVENENVCKGCGEEYETT